MVEYLFHPWGNTRVFLFLPMAQRPFTVGSRIQCQNVVKRMGRRILTPIRLLVRFFPQYIIPQPTPTVWIMDKSGYGKALLFDT